MFCAGTSRSCAPCAATGGGPGELGVVADVDAEPYAVQFEGGVGVALVEQRLPGHEVGLAIDTDKLASRYDHRRVEVPAVGRSMTPRTRVC